MDGVWIEPVTAQVIMTFLAGIEIPFSVLELSYENSGAIYS
jgi:hypothetical protein